MGQIDYERVFDALPANVLLLTRDFRIVAASKQRLEATMTRLEDIVGRDLFEVFPDNPNDPEATGVANLRASLNRVLKTGAADTMAVQKYDIPRPAEHGGGFEERYWSPVNAPVLDDDGSVRFIIHRVEDVTPLVQITREASAEREISDNLRERTRLMEEDILLRSRELQQAKDELEAQAELNTRFLAMASHELRTPITAIDGFALTMLQRWDDFTDADKNEFVSIIAEQSQRLHRLADDLLGLANMEAGKLHVEPTAVDVGAEVESVLRELELDEDVSMSCPERVVAYADRDHVHRIVVNLLTNARKYGRPPFEVMVSQDEQWARVCVADHGDGVPEEFVPHLFETFARASRERHTSAEGSGLGLSIVKQLALAQGGAVWYEPNSPCGAAFTARVPRAPA